MGIDRKVSNESHHVVLAPQPNVLPGDDVNLNRAIAGVEILRKRSGVKFRRVTRVEIHFAYNDIVFRIHSAVDGSFNAVVSKDELDLVTAK